MFQLQTRVSGRGGVRQGLGSPSARGMVCCRKSGSGGQRLRITNPDSGRRVLRPTSRDLRKRPVRVRDLNSVAGDRWLVCHSHANRL